MLGSYLDTSALFVIQMCRIICPSYSMCISTFVMDLCFLWINENLLAVIIYLHTSASCRVPFYLGMVGVGLNVIFFLYTSLSAWSSRKSGEKWDSPSTSALPFVTLLGIISFCL